MTVSAERWKRFREEKTSSTIGRVKEIRNDDAMKRTRRGTEEPTKNRESTTMMTTTTNNSRRTTTNEGTIRSWRGGGGAACRRRRNAFAHSFVSCVSLILAWKGASSSIPDWSLTCSQVTYGAVNSTVKLECQVKGLDLNSLTFYRIKWEKFPEESIVLEKISRDSENFQSSAGFVDRVWLEPDGISLQLRNLTSSDFGDYICEVLVAEGTEFDNQAVFVRLEEAVGPSIVRITGNRAVGENDRLVLTCQANLTNPVPELAWYQDGVQLRVSEPPINVFNASRKESKKTGVDISHVLTLTPMAGDNGGYIECRVTNGINGVRKSHTIQLNVTYPPSVPKLIGVSNNTWLVEDEDTAIVSCELQDCGNPPALLTLLSRGVVRMSEFALRVAYEHTRVTRSDNGSEFVCRAENAETDQKPKQSNAIVNVAFGPTRVTLTTSNSSVRAGDVIILRCLVEGSNPIPRIRWLKDEQPLEIHPKDLLSQGIPERDVYGGFSVTKEIRISVTPDDNRKSYACHAHNPKTKINEQTPLFLDVLYKPTWVSGHKRLYAVKLDAKVELVCPLAGNPPVAHWEWLLNGEPSRFHSTTSRNDSYHYASTLTIPSVTMEELGEYTCRGAADTQPKIFHNFTIDLMMAKVPELPKYCFHNITNIKNLKITCFPGFNGGADQDFKILVHDVYNNYKIAKDGVVSKVQNWIDYEIDQLMAGALYSFCAFSCNKYGCNECTSTNWLSVEMPVDPNSAGMSGAAIGFLVCGLLMLALGAVFAFLYMKKKSPTPVPKS